MMDFAKNKFMFSEEKRYRLSRHLLFWTVWGLWFFVPREFNPAFFQKNGHFANPIKIMIEILIILLSQPILVYPLLYFILPRYVFTGKYLKASLWIIGLLLLTVFVNSYWQNIPWTNVFSFLPSEYRPGGSGRGGFKISTPAWLSALLGSLAAA